MIVFGVTKDVVYRIYECKESGKIKNNPKQIL